MKDHKYRKPGIFTGTVLILFWLTFLHDTDAIYAAYILPGIMAAYAIMSGSGKKKENTDAVRPDRRTSLIAACFGVVYSLSVCLGNRTLFAQILVAPDYPLVRKAYFTLCVVLMLAAGFMIGYEILLFLLKAGISGHGTAAASRREAGKLPVRLFLSAFFLFWIIDILYLFLCGYPGNITTDSLSQIEQILTGLYEDQHPYWHTLVIRLFFYPVYRLTGDVNAGAAAFCTGQSCLLSLIFAYVTCVLYRFGGSEKKAKRMAAAAVLYYAFSPVHILYSITIWKDVLFGGAVALFIAALLIRLYGLETNEKGNLVLLIISAASICLFRSNGWIAMAAFTLCLLILYLRKNRDSKEDDCMAGSALKQVLLSFGAVLIVTFVMNHGILGLLNVEKGGFLEGMGVPLQMTGRVLYEKKSLSSSDLALIEAAAPVEEIVDAYNPGIADPIKVVLRSCPGEAYIESHKLQYGMLVLRLMIKHPSACFRGWADLTRGYWDAGLDHYLWAQGVGGNDLGLYATEYFAPARMIKNSYLWLFEKDGFLKLIKCMGLQIMLVLAIFCKGMAEKRKYALGTLPVIFIWLTILAAVPVNGEYRYMYCLATSLPILLAAAFGGRMQENR